MKSSVIQKLMLGAVLLGSEAGTNFIQMNLLPVQQMLGMPLSVATLVTCISGPTSILLLTSMGWLVDQGSSPQHRKLAATILVAGLSVLGMICILTADLIHLNDLYKKDENVDVHDVFSSPNGFVYVDCFNETGFSTTDAERDLNQLGNHTGNETSVQLTSDALNMARGCLEDNIPKISSEVPFKAGLAMLGFIVLVVGCDTTSSFAKLYIAACGSLSERTSMLVFCMIMASTGGFFSAVLGIVDVPAIPGLPFVDGNVSSRPQKVAMEAVLIMGCIAVGLPVTLLTGWALWRGQTHPSHISSDDPVHGHTIHTSNVPNSEGYVGLDDDETKSDVSSLEQGECDGGLSEDNKSSSSSSTELVDEKKPLQKGSSRPLSFGEFKECSNGFAGKNVKTPARTAKDTTGTKHITRSAEYSFPGEKERSSMEKLSFLKRKPRGNGTARKEVEIDLAKEGGRYATFSQCNHDAVEAGDTTSLKTEEKWEITKSEITTGMESRGKQVDPSKTRLPGGVKGTIALLVISTTFAMGTGFLFSVTISDYVAKDIYHGDPDEDASIESQSRYEEGVKMASVGFCIFYSSYLLFNIINPRLIGYLGCRTEFLLAQVLMAGTMVVLALTARLEVFFVLAAVAGMHRVTLFVIPYAAASNILRKADPENRQLGFVVSLITVSIPVADCLFVTWMGALESTTGVVSAPLWVAAPCSCLSAFLFLFVGDVE